MSHRNTDLAIGGLFVSIWIGIFLFSLLRWLGVL